MKKKLAKALVEVLKTADAYQSYKKEHPGTKKTPSDPLFDPNHELPGKVRNAVQNFNQAAPVGELHPHLKELAHKHNSKALHNIADNFNKAAPVHALRNELAKLKLASGDKALDQFVDYCWQFYAPGEIYGDYFDNNLTKKEVIDAAKQRMKDTKNWGDGDSFDREAVRDIMLKKRGK